MAFRLLSDFLKLAADKQASFFPAGLAGEKRESTNLAA
jgi:hypothetical protein